MDEAYGLARTVAHPVDIIEDCRRAPSPPNANAIGHLKRVLETRPDNLRWIVVVGVGDFMRNMGEILSSVLWNSRGVVRFARSLDEAEALIGEGRGGEVAAAIAG
jgi:hypothetical protein